VQGRSDDGSRTMPSPQGQPGSASGWLSNYLANVAAKKG
jgi:hypothetical protein